MSIIAIVIIAAILFILIKDNMVSSKKTGGGGGQSKKADSPITQEQIETLQRTWAMVVPIKEQAAELFYGKLFEMDPDVKPLFKGDMVEQGAKLMTSINVVITSLERLDEVVPVLQDLGKRHVAYGVTAAHYDTVGAALLWTLEQGLGDAFTEDVKATWAAAYGIIAQTMIDAAY